MPAFNNKINPAARRPEKGRALFYTRDSGGEHENTPGQYVLWAVRRSKEIGLSFNGTPDLMNDLIKRKGSKLGDLFLDYVVPGNELERQGLNALFDEARRDPTVSHVFIPRPDRLARPNEIMEGIQLEMIFCKELQLTLEYMNRVLPPVKVGEKFDCIQMMLSALQFDKAEKDRRELASKMINAQLTLARAGYSTGGRPCYGFCRWLVDDAGNQVRQLAEGESVKMKHHHVIWLPAADGTFEIRLRILEMLETHPATQVATTFTREGILTPDHDRTRKDNGIYHRTSGIWHSTTIVNIARHPLNLALRPYGRRSMGDRLRFDPDGPRTLDEQDFRADGEVKVIANPAEKVIVSGARFTSPVSPDQHQKLLAILDERAGTQRGKPRSRTPEKNPLGGRIFDCECRWPMYRAPYRESFQYVCGFYQQSNGSECNHNHIDGPLAIRLMLSTLRQNLLMPDKLAKLKRRFQELAAQESSSGSPEEEAKKNNAALARLEVQLDKAGRNLAGAETEAQRKAIGRVVDELSAQREKLEAKKTDIEASRQNSVDMKSEIEAAMELVYRLGEMAKNSDDFTTAKNFFDTLNARLFLRFKAEPWGKRMLRKISTGVLTVGNEPPPVVLYQGPTDRRSVKTMTAASSAAVMGGSLPPEASISQCPRPEGDSLGNLNRGDRI